MKILQLKKYYLLIKVKQFAYSSLDKKKQKQTKTIEDQGKKSLYSTSYKTCWTTKNKSIEDIFSKELQNNKFEKELDKTETIEEEVDVKSLIYKANKP